MSAIRGREALFVRVTFVLVVGLALLSGCASQPTSPISPRSPRSASGLAPFLSAPPAEASRLETAPPAARDALDSGLLWIVADAPETRVGQAPAATAATAPPAPPTAPKGGAQ